MSAAAEFITRKGHRFPSRVHQYKIVGSDPSGVVLENHLVKNRLTRQKFIMKVIPHDCLPEIRAQVMHELQALQKMSNHKEVIQLIDSFKDSEGNHYIVQ